MNPKIKLWAKHYLYGLFADSWNNAWNTVFIGSGVCAASDLPLTKALFLTFGLAMAKSVVFYFIKNPLPSTLPTE